MENVECRVDRLFRGTFRGVDNLAGEADAVAAGPTPPLDHSRWTSRLRTAYLNGDLARFNMLGQQYDVWCRKNNCDMEELGLDSLDVPSQAVASVNASTAVAAASTGSSSSKALVKVTIGGVLGHSLPPLSGYWDARMKSRTGCIALTIFDKAWLARDANFIRSRSAKVSCAVELSVYSGSRVLNDWRQSFMETETSMRLFIRYWKEVYQGEDGVGAIIGERLEKHWEIVLEVKDEQEGDWCPAKRYEIAHRQNVWAHRLPDGSMSDIGVRNEELVKKAIRESVRRTDTGFKDNPYQFGCERQNMSPYDGVLYPTTNSWDSSVNPLEFSSPDMLSATTKNHMATPIVAPVKETVAALPAAQTSSRQGNQAGNTSHAQNRTGSFGGN